MRGCFSAQDWLKKPLIMSFEVLAMSFEVLAIQFSEISQGFDRVGGPIRA